MPIDTSMYPTTAKNMDPMTGVEKAVEIRNLANNITKIRGGTPGTQNALNEMGAGQSYNTQTY